MNSMPFFTIHIKTKAQENGEFNGKHLRRA
jgi:hypothetical protein